MTLPGFDCCLSNAVALVKRGIKAVSPTLSTFGSGCLCHLTPSLSLPTYTYLTAYGTPGLRLCLPLEKQACEGSISGMGGAAVTVRRSFYPAHLRLSRCSFSLLLFV